MESTCMKSHHSWAAYQEQGSQWEKKPWDVYCEIQPSSLSPRTTTILQEWRWMWQRWRWGMCGFLEPAQKWCVWVANAWMKQIKKEQISHRTKNNVRVLQGWQRECSGYHGRLLGLHCQSPSGLASSWVKWSQPVEPNRAFHTSHVKHCPPELTVQFWATQLYRDTCLQPVSSKRQNWACCYFPRCSADLGFRSSVRLSSSL